MCACVRVPLRRFHVVTLSLLCIHSAAAYLPLVHVGRMGRVVRTHGLQLHLLRYNTNTHTILSKRRQRELRVTYFPLALQLPPAKKSSSQAAVNSFHVVTSNHSIEMRRAFPVPKRVVLRCRATKVCLKTSQ